ncbi:FMN-linked oxidoreductase [Leucogyrophana mollusca]|uniref:FMN-linked oxidoreductase n=1 Tax=Leucogyrophana mollusca TaxID=85980 RepID=A0ACB8BIV9_9AGAM|nr:FMN-linked oxidoreductase [Leucogyrophana mollusca]
MSSTPKLFQPIQVGDIALRHRVVMAPLTRFRAYADHVPGPYAATYYAQRASYPGSLLIAEATFITQQAGGFEHVPGIYTDSQIEGWKKVTDAVHEKGSFIFLQLWALGRAAIPAVLKEKENNSPYVSSSDVLLTGKQEKPRPLTIPEIKEYVAAYATAATNAIKAGFDGIEVHGANGYLVDQFTQDLSNKRSDEYGGSIENRCRFALEVVDAIVNAIGAQKTAIRLSPWSPFQDMGMEDPIPTFSYLVTRLKEHSLAYIHLVEPRIRGDGDCNAETSHSNDFVREIWGDRPFVSAGGYKRDAALEVAEKKGDLIAFGRLYIPNPDLPRRILENIPLVPGDRSTYYQVGNMTASGYSDWPFAGEGVGGGGVVRVAA